MIKYWKHISFFLLLSGVGTSMAFSQEIEPKQEINIDDLGNVSDKFQEYFFEALKQKAITNYDKAIEALEKCIEIDATFNFLYFELGKNYLKLKEHQKAEDNFKKVLKETPNNRYVLELLFEVYFAQRKYSESVEVVEKLVTFNPLFKEQLANLYYLEKRYDEALTLVDELQEEFGNDAYREQLRKRIAVKITNPNSQISRLEKKIEENPKEEQNYLNLIYLYSQDNQKDKAFELAKRLLKKKPKSELVHLALYKFYLNDNKTEDAINSMKIVLTSDQLDTEAKYKVVNDFLVFVNDHPEYEPKLIEVANLFSNDQSNDKVFTELGHYYYKKDQKEIALNYYERGIKNNTSDFTLLKRILLLQLDLKRYEKAKLGSELALELYPAQPLFYLVNGVSLINLDEAENAIEILSSGIDYIIDDLKMESDFYKQISQAYLKLENTTKASEYEKKAIQLQKKS
ncbi:tetratricopeptide repeat protein [Aquimarina sp. 2201CG5-10]|uniref:tetratricopeptide repeat protein n=1 Tax=Aquimarina callyspongiae TaxID=3098150 RepID=UPI002AB4D041|nr:tetratricopeptide repeat protein [Aquimarina sp. 2201CG5-10]MDY8138728.1 tetratricopeptide repeat protein [Aquimarina sp. 2201CG5-10]